MINFSVCTVRMSLSKHHGIDYKIIFGKSTTLAAKGEMRT